VESHVHIQFLAGNPLPTDKTDAIAAIAMLVRLKVDAEGFAR